MISFASFPPASDASGSYGTTRHHPDVEEDIHMDLDEDDFEEGVQRLTVPGESITSSHAFMRYASLFCWSTARYSCHLTSEDTERMSTTKK